MKLPCNASGKGLGSGWCRKCCEILLHCVSLKSVLDLLSMPFLLHLTDLNSSYVYVENLKFCNCKIHVHGHAVLNCHSKEHTRRMWFVYDL